MTDVNEMNDVEAADTEQTRRSSHGYTAGPWLVDGPDGTGQPDSVKQYKGKPYQEYSRVRATNKKGVAHIYHGHGDVGSPEALQEQLANARLIAAAPELFEACLMAVECCGDWGQEKAFRAIQAAKDAVAVARGERVRCDECNKRLGDEERGQRICELCSQCVPCSQDDTVQAV